MGALQAGRVFQTAFVVENLDAAIETFSRDLNIGGWLRVGGKRPWPAIYRGKPVELHLSVAMGFSGDMMFELIQQRDDGPSIYTETGGVGLHHLAIAVTDMAQALAGYAELGVTPIMSLEGAQGVATYLDVRPRLPAMLELVQMTPGFEAFVDMVYDLRCELGPEGPIVRRL